MTPKIETILRALVRKRPPILKHRPITPHDPNKPSLAALSQELVDLVVGLLHEIDPHSVNNLALVCEALRRTAREAQYRDVSIDLDWRSSSTIVERMNSMVRNEVLPVIRTLHVRTSRDLKRSLDRRSNARPRRSFSPRKREEPGCLTAWDQVCNLIPRMTGLREVHWEGEVVPDCVIAHLRRTPRACLHLSLVDLRTGDFARDEPEKNGAFLRELPARLAGTQGASSLRLGAMYGFLDKTTLEFVEGYLRPLLFSSPSLRKLSLNIGPPLSGCTAGNYASKYSGFCFSPGDTLPPLEELEMIAYPWGVMGNPGVVPAPADWPFNTGDVFASNMQNWVHLLDWSRLRRLHLDFDSVELAVYLAPYLTSLEHLEFGGIFHCNFALALSPLLTYLRTPSLKSITIPSLPDFTTWVHANIPINTPPFISLITAHAPTLHTLSIPEEPLTPTDLALLSTILVNLTTLTLCLARGPNPTNSDSGSGNGAWPLDALTVISSFPTLSSLTLSFDLGWRCGLLKPFLNFSAAETIWTALRSAGGAPRLRRLRLNSGFAPKPIRGLVYPEVPEWPAWRMRTGFEVGEGDGGVVVVRCVKLGWEGNERLRRVAKGEVEMTEEEGRDLDFLVALRGPMGYDKWLGWRRPVVVEPKARG